uniref:GA12046PAlike [Tribolium castaneum] n=1 Tax=Lepeophtheirus salmonis TaxID=72036 RepID=A0A0K2TYS3_LEPSM
MEGCLKEFKEEFSREKWALSSKEPGRFTRSQWCPEDKCSLWYLIYRWAIALIFIITICGHIGHVYKEWKGASWKWVIFMTQQGISILCLTYIFDAILVTYRYLGDKKNTNRGMHMPLTHKISWALSNMSFTVAIYITIVYWALLHQYVLKANMLKTNGAVAFNFFMHAINTLSIIIDFFVSDRPWRILHFYFSVIFGIWYLIFSVSYWAAGGTGFCRPQETTDTSVVAPEECDPFIYPILDYENKPGMAVAVVLGGTLFLPFLQTFYFLLYQLRLKLYRAIYPNVETQNLNEIPFLSRN